MYCPNCGQEVSESMNYCPKCGRRIPGYVISHQSPNQYYHQLFGFSFDDIQPCYQNGVFLGILVWKAKKVGFLCKKGNPLGIMYLPCEYDTLRPILNKSSYNGGQAPGLHILFEAQSNGRWGVCFSQINSRTVGLIGGIPFTYDSVHVIREYPAIAIVKRGKNECLLSVGSAIALSEEYDEFIEVIDKTNSKCDGLYYAGIRSWESDPWYYGRAIYKKGKADIFDLINKKKIDTDIIEDLLVPFEGHIKNKEGNRWRFISR